MKYHISKRFLIKSCLLLLFLLVFVTENVKSENKELLRYNANFAGHFYDFTNLNKTLQDASYPKITDKSLLMGIGIDFNYIFYQDTAQLSERPEFIKNIYFSLGYYFKVLSPLDYYSSSDKGSKFTYNMVMWEFTYPIQIFNFLTINPSLGFTYNWGTLTLADSLGYSYNFQDYISHPPIFNEFSLLGITFSPGLGFYLNIQTLEEKQGDKSIFHRAKIGIFAHYFLNMDINSKSSEVNPFWNSVGKSVPGLITSFPKGLMLELRVTQERVTYNK